MKTKVTRARANSTTAAVVVVYVNEITPSTIIRVEDVSGPGEPMWRARAFRVLREANEYVGEAVADTPDEAERRARKIAKYRRGQHDARAEMAAPKRWDRKLAEAEIRRLMQENDALKGATPFARAVPPMAPAEQRGELLAQQTMKEEPGKKPYIMNPPPSAPH